MQLQTIGSGPYPDFSVSDGVIAVGGVVVDVRERQTDTQQVIDIRATGAVFSEGEGEHLVASIRIPPRRYADQPTGDEDGDGNPIVEPVAQPLDINEVHLTLWPYA